MWIIPNTYIWIRSFSNRLWLIQVLTCNSFWISCNWAWSSPTMAFLESRAKSFDWEISEDYTYMKYLIVCIGVHKAW